MLFVAEDPLSDELCITGIYQALADRREVSRCRASLQLAVADARNGTTGLTDVGELGEIQDLVGLGRPAVRVVSQLLRDQEKQLGEFGLIWLGVKIGVLEAVTDTPLMLIHGVASLPVGSQPYRPDIRALHRDVTAGSIRVRVDSSRTTVRS